jgi:hypothetical protein
VSPRSCGPVKIRVVTARRRRRLDAPTPYACGENDRDECTDGEPRRIERSVQATCGRIPIALPLHRGQLQRCRSDRGRFISRDVVIALFRRTERSKRATHVVVPTLGKPELRIRHLPRHLRNQKRARTAGTATIHASILTRMRAKQRGFQPWNAAQSPTKTTGSISVSSRPPWR